LTCPIFFDRREGLPVLISQGGRRWKDGETFLNGEGGGDYPYNIKDTFFNVKQGILSKWREDID